MSAMLRDTDLANALRHAVDTGVACFSKEGARVLADAIDIADSCARSDIECNTPGDATGWYDTTATKEDHDAWLAQSLRYLDARGLIERNPAAPHLVRFPKVTP